MLFSSRATYSTTRGTPPTRRPGMRRRSLWPQIQEIAAGRASASSPHSASCYKHAIDVSLREGEWSEAERYAAALEDYVGGDPWPYVGLLVQRGRSLAAYGRGDRNPDLVRRIDEVREECRSHELWAPSFEWVLEKEEAVS